MNKESILHYTVHSVPMELIVMSSKIQVLIKTAIKILEEKCAEECYTEDATISTSGNIYITAFPN